MTRPTCESCRWLLHRHTNPYNDRAQGTCGRYPPHPEYGRPTVYESETCGEHTPTARDAGTEDDRE